MKERLVKRYYCDFCKISKGTKFAMKKHENRCTMNPDRVCGICSMVEGVNRHDIQEMVDIIKDGTLKSLENLRKFTDNCPSCILAAIRQSKTGAFLHDFDFKKELQGAYENYFDNDD